MNSVPRKLTIGVLLAVGAAACGDDVTVTETPGPTPVVRSVTVSPSSATVAQGGSFQFGAAVDADAGVVRTVTWSAAGGTGITVNSTSGLAAASATATGTASICATADAVGFTDVKSCASLTVSAPAAAATVQIDAITEGCTPLNAALPGHPAACGLLVPVQTQNAGAQIDVATIVQRPPNSGITAVQLDVICVTAPCAAGVVANGVEATYTETLTGDFIAQTDELAAQQTLNNRIVFSVNTAAYTLTGTTAAVRHTNGQKKVRVTLVGGTATGTAETQLTFRNANGWHIAMGTLVNNNAAVCGPVTALAACPVSVNSTTTGLNWRGGTSIPITASPVNYTGFVIAQGPGTNVAFGSVPGTVCAGADVAGIGTRTQQATVAAGVNGALTGTLVHTALGVGVAAAGNVDGYAIAPAGACAAGGESPFATGVDATGASFIIPGFALGGNFAGNVLNNVNNPVVPTLAVVSPIRLDNAGPNPINGYATGRNPNFGGTGGAAVSSNDRCFGLFLNAPNTDAGGGGCPGSPASLLVGGVGPSINNTVQSSFVGGRTARMNGWMNDAANFGAIHANAIAQATFAFPGTYTTPVAGDPAGVISPSPTPTGLPIDIGIGGAIAGVPANPITFVGRIGTCTTVATCAALTVARTTTGAQGAATALAETNGANPANTLVALPGYGAIVQTVDPFGNLTNPPVFGTAAFVGNFGAAICPPGVPNAGVAVCVPNQNDPANPYVDNGVLFIGVDRLNPTVAVTGAAGTTFTNNTIQVLSNNPFTYTTDDPVNTGLFNASGIISDPGPVNQLFVSLARRDGATLQYFCVTSANYQPAGNACGTVTGWATSPTLQNTNALAASATVYNRTAGAVLSDPAASVVRAYYAVIAFTRDQAGNQSTTLARDFIFDNTTPSSFGAVFSPGVLPPNGPVTFSGNATEDLDVGRGTFSIRFPSLNFAANLTGGDLIRLQWANKNAAGQLANPIGYLAPGPSALALPLSVAWSASIRSIEVVSAGDPVPGGLNCGGVGCYLNAGFAVGVAAAGAVNFPGSVIAMNGGVGYVQDGNLANGAGPTQFNFFTQSVSRVGLNGSLTGAVPATVPANQGTALAYGQTGMGSVAMPCTGAVSTAASTAYWTSIQLAGVLCGGVNNPFFNMGWSLLNPIQAAPVSVDLNGAGIAGANGASKNYTAIAIGANGVLSNPFTVVKFFGVDIRQPLNVDASGGIPAAPAPAAALAVNGTGIALIELCTVIGTGSSTPGAPGIFNDQATNTWQYTCAFNPSNSTSGGNATSVLQTYDFFGFNTANNANLHGAPTGVVVNAGFWGNNQPPIGPYPITAATVPGFHMGWQGNTAQAAFAAAAAMPVIAVGCNATANCLATRVSANAGFSVTP